METLEQLVKKYQSEMVEAPKPVKKAKKKVKK